MIDTSILFNTKLRSSRGPSAVGSPVRLMRLKLKIRILYLEGTCEQTGFTGALKGVEPVRAHVLTCQ